MVASIIFLNLSKISFPFFVMERILESPLSNFELESKLSMNPLLTLSVLSFEVSLNTCMFSDTASCVAKKAAVAVACIKAKAVIMGTVISVDVTSQVIFMLSNSFDNVSFISISFSPKVEEILLNVSEKQVSINKQLAVKAALNTNRLIPIEAIARVKRARELVDIKAKA